MTRDFSKVALTNVRHKLPTRTVIGYSGAGEGTPHPIDMDELIQQAADFVQVNGGGGTTSFADPTAIAGDVAVNGSASTAMRSDAAPAIQKTSATEFGIAKVDGTTITEVGGVISAAASGANPTATASDVAVNGSATTFMRSDAAPAVEKCSASVFGLAKVDNSTIIESGGVISATGFSPAAAAFHPGYSAGRFYGPPGYGAAAASLSTSTTQIYLTAFYVPVPVTFTKATIHSTSATGTPHVTMGLYANLNGQPHGAPLYNFGDIAISSTGAVDVTITGLSITLAPGWYWLAVGSNGTSNIQGMTNTFPAYWVQGYTATTGAFNSGYTQTWTYSAGNLPTIGTLNAISTTIPVVLLSF